MGDLLINVNCPNSQVPMVCEIQLHHKLFYQHKKISHKMYKIARIFEIDGRNLAYEYADEHIRKSVGDKIYEVENDEEGTDPVELLKEWKLDQYIGVLIEEEGYDDVAGWKEEFEWHSEEKFKELTGELKEMGFKPGHAKKFLREVAKLQ